MTDDMTIDIRVKETVYKGYFRIDRYTLRHTLHRGGLSGEMMREVFERGHAVAVLPYDPVRDEIILVEQFRIGAMAAGLNAWEVEVPAGIIGDGETPEGVARREMKEETGLDVKDILPLYHYLVSPGGTTETVALFCAQVDTANAGGVFGLDEEHEDILVLPTPVDEAFALLDQGKIQNGMTIIALQWLKLNRDDLRGRWRNDA